MKLFLASQVKNPSIFLSLTEIIGGDWASQRILYIPTAANGEQPRRNWREGETWKMLNQTSAKMTVVELEHTLPAKLPALLDQKTIIWFAGGVPGYLLYWIRRLQLDTYLSPLLNQGCIYVGSSAGSMIAGPSMKVSEWYIGENEPGAQYLPGLGLVDFEIYPHFQPELLPQIKKQFTQGRLYLLKDNDALFINQDQTNLIGTPTFLELT